VPSIFAFLQMVLADQDRTENIIKLCVGLVGDLAEMFPQGQIKAQVQKDWVAEAIKISRTRLGAEGKATAKWAKEVRAVRRRRSGRLLHSQMVKRASA
jgi:importin subunit beta-1